MRLRLRILLTAGVLTLVGVAWARKPGDPIKPGFNLFSKLHDIQIGQAAAFQVKQQYQVVPNAFLQDYVRRCGERLSATPEARQSGFFYGFTLLNVPQVNAFALPGGPMFIFTGLVNATENEAQLIGVMAHEMSHVILRHGTHEASKANLLNVTAVLAGAAAGSGTAVGQLARLGLGLGANSLILKFSREAESEADALGSHLMAEAGYNPIEMARFFEKLAANGNQGLQFFSDHPNPENRQRAIESEIRGLPQREYNYQTGDFARAKLEVVTVPGRGEPSGTVAPNGPAPPAVSGTWQQLSGSRFSVAYPGNWAAEGDNQSTRWTIAPKDGLVKGAGGTLEVGYGVVVSYFSPSFGRADLGTATLELIGHLHGERPNLQLSNAPQQKVRVDGTDGMLTMLANRSPLGGVEADALLTVARPDSVFYMLCVAPQGSFAQMQGAFRQMMASIRFVN